MRVRDENGFVVGEGERISPENWQVLEQAKRLRVLHEKLWDLYDSDEAVRAKADRAQRLSLGQDVASEARSAEEMDEMGGCCMHGDCARHCCDDLCANNEQRSWTIGYFVEGGEETDMSDCVLLKRAPEAGDPWIAAGTWEPITKSDGSQSAMVGCGKCGKNQTLTGHQIAPDGAVSPSLQCSFSPCDWHVFVTLENWP